MAHKDDSVCPYGVPSHSDLSYLSYSPLFMSFLLVFLPNFPLYGLSQRPLKFIDRFALPLKEI